MMQPFSKFRIHYKLSARSYRPAYGRVISPARQRHEPPRRHSFGISPSRGCTTRKVCRDAEIRLEINDFQFV